MGEPNAVVCSECQGRLHIREIQEQTIHTREGTPKVIQKVVWRRCDCVEARLEEERLGAFYHVAGDCPQATPYLKHENAWFICPKIETVRQIVRNRLLGNKRPHLFMSVADLSFDKVKAAPEDAILKSAGYYEYPQFFLTFGYGETSVREFMLKMAREVILLRHSHGKGTWLFTPSGLDTLTREFPFAREFRDLPFTEILKLG